MHFIVDEDRRTVSILPIYEEFGSIEIQDDGSELTIYVGNFTHWHASCYEEDLSDMEKEETIAEDVAEFLHDVFNDKIIMWGSNKGSGGFIARDEQQSQKFIKCGFGLGYSLDKVNGVAYNARSIKAVYGVCKL